LYIRDTIQFSVLGTLSNSLFGVLWIRMCPTRLPRGVNSVIVWSVYHPPNANNSEMLNYLTETLSIIEANYFGCGIIILDDFSQLNVRRINTNFNLKQNCKLSHPWSKYSRFSSAD
jgi:hypothetical protein